MIWGQVGSLSEHVLHGSGCQKGVYAFDRHVHVARSTLGRLFCDPSETGALSRLDPLSNLDPETSLNPKP